MRNVLKYVIRIDNYILLCMKNEVIKFVFIMFNLKFILQSQIKRYRNTQLAWGFKNDQATYLLMVCLFNDNQCQF